MNLTSLAESEGTCESTLDGLAEVLMTRRKYSSDPVLNVDIERLVWISSRWIDDCLNVSPGLRSGEDFSSLLRVVDLILGQRVEFQQPRSFYRFRLVVLFVLLELETTTVTAQRCRRCRNQQLKGKKVKEAYSS